MKTTKAVVLRKFNQPLEMEEIAIPELKTGEVLVKMTAAGVCGSDAHMWRGNDPRTNLPMILGHEGVGKVVAINGEKETIFGEKLKEGDSVLWHRGISCHNCYFCQVLKQPALCNNRWVYGIHRSRDQYPYLLGCYLEYLILDTNTDIFIIPDNVPPENLVAATCSGSTSAHAFDLCPPMLGDTVVIQGPGPLGIFSVAFAKYMGAQEIIVIGGTDARLEMCKEFGATTVLNRNTTTEEERLQAIKDLTYGRGADVVYEMAGSPQTVREGLNLVRVGGSYASAGFGEPRGTIEIDCFKDIVRKNLRYQGVWVSDTRHTYQAYKLVLNNVDLFGKLVTHKFSLAQATQALEIMEQKEAIKAVLIP